MRSVILSAFAMLLVVACGGKSEGTKKHHGDGGQGGQGGGGGQPYDPCAGKECGDACTLCDPADRDCVETLVVKACDPNGACVPDQPGLCGGGQQCTYDGETYEPGESFPAGDGCNTCTCAEDGSVACTLIACPDVCGGPDGLTCAADEYCNYPIGSCGAGGATGVCELRPVLCPDIYEPVCACDDKTFGNACEAAAEGKSLAQLGPCEE